MYRLICSSLLALATGSKIAPASEMSCAAAAQAYATCAVTSGTAEPIKAGANEQINDLLNRYQASLPFSPACQSAARAGEVSCGADAPELKEARRRLYRNARSWDKQPWRKAVVMQARALAKPLNLAVTCVPMESESFERCLLLDRSRPRTVEIDRSKSSELPLTVGISGRCTFTLDPYGHLITADHCGETLRYGGWIMNPIAEYRLSPEPLASLQVSVVNVKSGRPYEDLSVWQSRAAPRGRPFYVLTRDDTRDRGCEVEAGYFLNCAPAEFSSLDGRRAHVLGFPTLRYSLRDRTESVVRSDGDLRFDAEGNRFLIHAAVSPGSSGGPTYLSAGECVGGVCLDRPLFLGPLSAFVGSDVVTTVDQSDVLAIVPVYASSDLRRTLPAN